ncbi:hypothetical protein [Microvirga tunisiensis]|uniref:Uncharacterized protein n=1 Tax=Microvirga tunisiensis TaxID=2108360 RepID=A0A5N7MXH4_9HYPH|nr:hypothetical protein [Microvirga tunisiensis]MPR13820.1 hypothetical protein [Microvirga tunisiensis]MPR31651.1 hypothetical protein [Microvirga tunisiensis]
MAKKNYDAERKKAATALRQLGSILTKKQVCADIGPLNSAAEQCSKPAHYGANSWGYDISNLRFELSDPRKSLPAKTRNLRIELSISLNGSFDADVDDQFKDLEINIEKYVIDRDGVELKASWHFDRHIVDLTKDVPDETVDVHPLYHFQYGGAKMHPIGDRLGKTFLIDPPRLMHPPMDGILAVDFVLANYAGAVWKKLRDDSQYMNLVNEKLNQYWKPY